MKEITRTTKIAQGLSMFIVGIAILLVIYISYLLLYPVNFLTVKQPLPVTPTTVNAGDVVTLKFEYCKTKEFDSHISIDFIGPYVVPTLSTTRDFPNGCHTELLPISVPSPAPTGEYIIHMEVTYQVNPISKRSYKFDSVKIQVNDEKQTH